MKRETKRKMVHILHPMHIWCRLNGKGIKYCRLYELYVWKYIRKPLTRRTE